MKSKKVRPFLTYPAVIDWLQWSEFSDKLGEPDWPQVTLNLIAEMRAAIKKLEAEQKRLEKENRALFKALDQIVLEIEQSGCDEYMNEASACSDIFNKRLAKANAVLAKARKGRK